jgi:hypothetical protein
MPRQDVTLWKPDTCDCELYFTIGFDGEVVFVDAEDVRYMQQARIASGDPSANKALAPPAKLCSAHAAKGHRLYQNLISVIKEEQSRRDSAIALVKEADPETKPEEVQWFYDSDRLLHVLAPQKVNKGKRDSWQLGCDMALGQGKVKVEETAAVIMEG